MNLGRVVPAVMIAFALVLGGSPIIAGAKIEANTPAAASTRPNIVFILTDDLSWNLVNNRFAPHIMQLQRQGETFDHYFVADSLCCPSRSTIFTGLFPHDTHVITNLPPEGGFQKFQAENLAQRTFAVATQRAGYTTSMLGKYLNGYGISPKMMKKKKKKVKTKMFNPATAPIPPGWSDWHVSNNSGYLELDFYLNDNGTFDFYGGPNNYGVDVANSSAQQFIDQHAGNPFLVEVATFAPHAPFTPAPRNANDFPGLTEPRDPSFNTANVNPPAWLANRPVLPPGEVTTLDAIYRKRAQAVEAVDKLVADTEATLAAHHLSKNTYIVFSSDNGYHLGQHRLDRGKQTAFDTDIRVPLIVAGPGVPHGKVVHQVAQNVDLYPTFVQLARAKPARPVDGHTLVPLLHPSKKTPTWRTAALVEHHQLNTKEPGDPDFEGGHNPTTYEAIRVSAKHLPGFHGPIEAVYVEYVDRQHETEYYDITRDPYEHDNIANRLTGAQRNELHKILVALERCHTASTCWKAGSPK